MGANKNLLHNLDDASLQENNEEVNGHATLYCSCCLPCAIDKNVRRGRDDMETSGHYDDRIECTVNHLRNDFICLRPLANGS